MRLRALGPARERHAHLWRLDDGHTACGRYWPPSRWRDAGPAHRLCPTCQRSAA